MANKTVYINEIGDVKFSKRKRAKNIKIRIVGSLVSVTLPNWTPYSTAITYVKHRSDWIIANKKDRLLLTSNQKIGKNLTLQLSACDSRGFSSKIKEGVINVKIPRHLDFTSDEVQQKLHKYVIKALQSEAEELIIPKVRTIAKAVSFDVNTVEIRKLKSRWGSCNNHKNLTFNLFLIQLPWDLIDYVIYHELSHTVHLNHGIQFWNLVEKFVPNYKQLRRQMKSFSPDIIL